MYCRRKCLVEAAAEREDRQGPAEFVPPANVWQPRDTCIYGRRQWLREDHQKLLHACINSSKTSDLEQGKFPVFLFEI